MNDRKDELQAMLNEALQIAELQPLIAEVEIDEQRYVLPPDGTESIERHPLWDQQLHIKELYEGFLTEGLGCGEALAEAIEASCDALGDFDAPRCAALLRSVSLLQELLQQEEVDVDEDDVDQVAEQAAALQLAGVLIDGSVSVMLTVDAEALPAELESKLTAMCGRPVGTAIFNSLLAARMGLEFDATEKDELIVDQTLYAATALHIQFGVSNPEGEVLIDLAEGLKTQMEATQEQMAKRGKEEST